jgi:hypothetical protein
MVEAPVETPVEVATLQQVDVVTGAPVKAAKKKTKRKKQGVKQVEGQGKVEQPCFQHFIGGGCPRKDCGYSHTVPDGYSIKRERQKVVFVQPSVSESKVNGSNANDLSIVAYFRSDECSKPFSGNGYLRQFQNTLHFITHRHSIGVDDKPCVVDDYCGDSLRGQLLGRDGQLVNVTLVNPGGTSCSPTRLLGSFALNKVTQCGEWERQNSTTVPGMRTRTRQASRRRCSSPTTMTPSFPASLDGEQPPEELEVIRHMVDRVQGGSWSS